MFSNWLYFLRYSIVEADRNILYIIENGHSNQKAVTDWYERRTVNDI